MKFQVKVGKKRGEKCGKGEDSGKRWGSANFALLREITKLESGRLHKLFTSPQKAHLHSGQVSSLLIAPPFVVSYTIAESYTELRATTA